MKNWWIAFPDGQKFQVSSEEILKGIDSGRILRKHLVSFQNGPWIPIAQVEDFRNAFFEKELKARKDSSEASKKAAHALVKLFGGILCGAVLIVFLAAYGPALIQRITGDSKNKNQAPANSKAAEVDYQKLREEEALSELSKTDTAGKLKNAEGYIAIADFEKARRCLKSASSDPLAQKEILRLEKKIEQREKEIKIESGRAINREPDIPLGPEPKNSSWDGSVRECVAYLEKTLNDPGSMKCSDWSSPQTCDFRKGTAWKVQCTVRAKNAFGAYVAKRVSFYILNNQVVASEGL